AVFSESSSESTSLAMSSSSRFRSMAAGLPEPFLCRTFRGSGSMLFSGPFAPFASAHVAHPLGAASSPARSRGLPRLEQPALQSLRDVFPKLAAEQGPAGLEGVHRPLQPRKRLADLAVGSGLQRDRKLLRPLQVLPCGLRAHQRQMALLAQA